MAKDAQALCFLHRPFHFDSSLPENFLKLFVQLSRSSAPGVIPLEVDAATYRYKRWKGPVPGAKPEKMNSKPPKRSGIEASQGPEMEELSDWEGL